MHAAFKVSAVEILQHHIKLEHDGITYADGPSSKKATGARKRITSKVEFYTNSKVADRVPKPSL